MGPMVHPCNMGAHAEGCITQQARTEVLALVCAGKRGCSGFYLLIAVSSQH